MCYMGFISDINSRKYLKCQKWIILIMVELLEKADEKI